MSIHIIFTDGSNPYIRYNMTPEDFAREVLKWCKFFDLEYIGTTGDTILQFKATDKASAAPAPSGDDMPPW